MLVVIKWVSLFMSFIYTIDNVRNRIKGYGIGFFRKFLVVGGIIGFIVCQLWEVLK